MSDISDTVSSDAHSGGCLCGAIRYRIRGAPTSSAHCHCRSCRKAAGAGFVTWAGMDEKNFSVTQGHVAVCESSPGVSRGFCGQCGSALTYAAKKWAGEIYVTAATLDEPGAVTPTAHVYVEEKLPWVRLDDGLPQHQRFPGD